MTKDYQTRRTRCPVWLSLVFLALPIGLPSGYAAAPDDREMHPSCRHCGMDRVRFAHARLLITYADGVSVGLCSLRCAAVDLALNVHRLPQTLRVADFISRDLVEAADAHWVLGGGKPGVMTRRAKWAFAKREEAEAFLQQHGGDPVDFDQALKASYEDIYEDVQSVRRQRLLPK